MSKTLQISIPSPCHENWQDMTPVEKGRFCDSCRKNVIDFTKASDREIAMAFANQGNLCGRFRNDQLNRELFLPREKNKLWIAAGIAVLGFLGIGVNEAKAQELQTTEQTEPAAERPKVKLIGPRLVSGTVITAIDSIPLEFAGISNKASQAFAISDASGNFSLQAALGDIIEIYLVGYETITVTFDGDNLTAVKLEKDPDPPYQTLGGAVMGIRIPEPEDSQVPSGTHSIWDFFR